MQSGGRPPAGAGRFLRWGGTDRKVGRTAHPKIGMRRIFATMLALATLAGCGENSSTGPTTVNLVGTWTLQSVNGGSIPYTQTTSAGKTEVMSGSIVISGNGAFTTTVVQRVTPAGSANANIVVVTTYGTVEIGGPFLVFKRADVPNDPGTTAELTSTTISYTQNGLALVFAKT